MLGYEEISEGSVEESLPTNQKHVTDNGRDSEDPETENRLSVDMRTDETPIAEAAVAIQTSEKAPSSRLPPTPHPETVSEQLRQVTSYVDKKRAVVCNAFQQVNLDDEEVPERPVEREMGTDPMAKDVESQTLQALVKEAEMQTVEETKKVKAAAS